MSTYRFVTGVSPVTMDDLTSGFNIGTNYSTSPEFNELTGFTEEDVREMLDYYRTTCEFHHTTDELIEAMKPWYDNYCFAEESYAAPPCTIPIWCSISWTTISVVDAKYPKT